MIWLKAFLKQDLVLTPVTTELGRLRQEFCKFKSFKKKKVWGDGEMNHFRLDSEDTLQKP